MVGENLCLYYSFPEGTRQNYYLWTTCPIWHNWDSSLPPSGSIFDLSGRFYTLETRYPHYSFNKLYPGREIQGVYLTLFVGEGAHCLFRLEARKPGLTPSVVFLWFTWLRGIRLDTPPKNLLTILFLLWGEGSTPPRSRELSGALTHRGARDRLTLWVVFLWVYQTHRDKTTPIRKGGRPLARGLHPAGQVSFSSGYRGLLWGSLLPILCLFEFNATLNAFTSYQLALAYFTGRLLLPSLGLLLTTYFYFRLGPPYPLSRLFSGLPDSGG